MAATSGNTGGGITELAQLIRSQQPLEDLIPERNQEDNYDVLEYVNSFLDVVDEELKSPKIYKEYVFGSKEAFVRSAMMPRIELIASRIIEKKSLACSTLSLDDLDFFQQELELYADLYFLLVTTLIDLVSIRKTDLVDSNSAVELFLAIQANLVELAKYDEIQDLNNELTARKDQYPEKPLLTNRIVDLISAFPITKEEFVFAPTKSVENYSNGEVLVSIQPDADVDSVEIGGLPNGIGLNFETGDVYVTDANLLEPGDYDIILHTMDAAGGFTTIHLELPIGINDIPRYELAPAKVIQAYSVGDILARPTLSEYVPEIRHVEWIETDVYPIPTGVSVNSLTGEVTVVDDDLLIIGVYPVRISITTKNGSRSRHEFSLNFKQDSKAVYTKKPTKSIGELKTGDVLATASDPDGSIVVAQQNYLPSGVSLDQASGEIVVANSAALKAGTHLFNVIVQDSHTVQSLKTLFLTFDKGPNSFSYSLPTIPPVDDLIDGTKVADLVSSTNEVAAKVSLIQGVMPSGITMDATGGFVVSNSSALTAGNFDLRVKVLVNGPGLQQIQAREAAVLSVQGTINEREANLASEEAQLNAEQSALNSYKSNFGFQKQKLADDIAAIELALQTATGNEAAELTAQLQIKQEQQAQLLQTGNAAIATQEASIASLESGIATINAELDGLYNQLGQFKKQLLRLETDRWVEYEVPLLLTLEDDKPSAWHVEIPKDFDEYEDNEIVAQLIDCDGYDDFEILSGTLPAGMDINTEQGTIEVINSGQIVAGEFVLETRSTDKQSGTTDHRLAIIIEGASISTTEQYIVRAPKPGNNYVDNEILGYPYNPNYAIVSARVSSGLLPNGADINTETGALYVADKDSINAGIHDGISIKTTNSSGSSNYHNISLVFGAKTNFEVTTKAPQPITDYLVGDKMVKVLLTNGSLQGIQIVDGDLPPGLLLSSGAGLITVNDLNVLEEGVFTFDLRMVDVSGASDEQTVELTIGPEGTKDTVIWNIVKPIDKNKVTNGSIVASPGLLGYTIVNASSSTLSTNFALAANGVITVANALKLVDGAFPVQITLTDNIGRDFDENIILTVTGGTVNTVVINTDVHALRDFHLIKTGDLMSSLIPESEVTGVTISEGAIPIGSVLNGLNGRVSVGDRVNLGRGISNAMLSVQTGGGAAAKAATSVSLQDVELEIDIIEIPKFFDVKVNEFFILAIVDRLEQFESDYMQDGQVAVEVSPYFDESVAFSDWLSTVLVDPTGRQRALAGEYDALNGQRYLKFGAGIVSKMEGAKSSEEIKALLNLFNEFSVTTLALTLFRLSDISKLSNNPIAVLYMNMSSHIAAIAQFADPSFIQENAGMINDNMDTKMTNLINRFSTLGPWK